MKADARPVDACGSLDMDIVDTFTRLIFSEEDSFDEHELAIVAALRQCEPELATGDSAELGDFLRAMGVSEMIALVGRVHAQIDLLPGHLASQSPSGASLHRRLR